MIKIYDKNNNFIKQIDIYKDMKIEKEINKLDLLFFNIPKSLGDLFEEEGYVETKNNGKFIIKEKNLGNDGCEIVGRYDLEEFNDWIDAKAYVTETPKEMLEDLLEGKDWEVVSSINIKRTVTVKEMSIISIIKKVVDTFNAEVVFDNVDKKVYIEEELGSDKGVYFIDELNLRRLNISSDTYDFATRMIPRGVNGEGIEQINNGIPYVENHTYSDKIITVIWEDERYTVMDNLKEDAEKKLEVLSKPRRAFTCDIANLASVSDEYSILDYNLGDTITLVEKESGTREKQRIMKLVHYPGNPLKDTIDIENRPRKLGDREEERIENLEGSNSVIKASLELLEDSVVSTVKRLENLVVNADNRLYQSQTNIPFCFNNGDGEITINRSAFHPYYKVTSNENVDLSINFPLNRYAENLVGKEVTISLDVMTEMDSTATIEDKEYELKANEWVRIHITKDFPATDTRHIRVRTRYSKKQSRDIKLGDSLIDSLKVDIDTLYYRNLQVQKGDIPTNWTLTPEELEGQIGMIRSEFKQLADSITFKFESGNFPLKGKNYTFDIESFSIGGTTGDVARHDEKGSTYMHEDGSYTKISSEGLMRYTSRNNFEYNYLVHVGEVRVDIVGLNNEVVITLPDEFVGKEFNAFTSIARFSLPPNYMFQDVQIFIREKDYKNNRIRLSASLWSRKVETHLGSIRSGGTEWIPGYWLDSEQTSFNNAGYVVIQYIVTV